LLIFKLFFNATPLPVFSTILLTQECLPVTFLTHHSHKNLNNMKNPTLPLDPVITRMLVTFTAITIFGLVYMCTIQLGDLLPALLSSVRHELSNIAYQLLYIR